MPRMALLAALATMLAAGLLSSTAAAAPTIKTLAGGGTQTPIYYDQSGTVQGTDAMLPAPNGIAWAGDPSGIFYVIPTGSAPQASNPQCVLEWYEPDDGKDTGFLGMWGGGLEDCTAYGPGYTSGGSCQVGGCGARYVKLGHPCCVAAAPTFSDDTNSVFGPLVSSPDTGYVNFYSWWTNLGYTTLGGSREPDCGKDPFPAPPDGVDPTTAHFCTLTALASRQGPRYDWLVAESGRVSGEDFIYQVVEPAAGDPTPRQVLVVAESDPVTAVAWDDDKDGNFIPLWADSTSAVYRRIGNAKQLFAGNPSQPGFSGDGGPAVGAKLNHPQGLAAGFDGQLYIADTDNCRIRRKTRGPINDITVATITTVAGNGCSDTPAPYGDGGPATDANLDHPTGIAMSPAGLLISDTRHNRVRLLDRTTITGGPKITSSANPSFTVESLDSPPNLKCKLDDAAAASCTSPVELPGLSEGPHTLNVWEAGQPTDISGPDPADPTPAVANFTIDRSPPTGLGLRAPAAGAKDVPVTGAFSWDAAQDAFTAVDHYELWVDGAKNRDVPTGACANGVCSAGPAVPLSEGNHTWQIKAVDLAGNTAESETRSLAAGGPPTAVIVISPNPALVGRGVTFDGSHSSDESGITHYEWDLNGDGTYETDGGASPTLSRTFGAPLAGEVGLRVTDGAGKTAAATAVLTVSQPTGSALLSGISINSGAQYTRDPHVNLLIKPPANASGIIVSNDGGFLVPQTFKIATTIPWVLDSSGPERLPKTVYARFLLGPIITLNFTDDIILDEVPPVVKSAAISPLGARSAASVAVAASAAAKWKVKSKATDSNSGVASVQVTANKRKPGPLLRYKKTLTVKSATKPKFVRARDKAGNFSKWKTAR